MGVSFEMYLRRHWDVQRDVVRRRYDVLLPGGNLKSSFRSRDFRNFSHFFPHFLQRRLEVAFGKHFIHNCYIKMLLDTLPTDKVSMSYFSPSQDIKQNVLLS